MSGTPRSRAELEALFESGDQPTQQDFADLIASFLLADGSDLPNPLPALSGEDLLNIATADPLPAVNGAQLTGINIQEWKTVLSAPNYATSTSFVHSENLTTTYVKDRRVRLLVNNIFEYSDVLSSSYDANANATTVVIRGDMPSNLLTAVSVSIFLPFNSGGAISPLMLRDNQDPVSLSGFSYNFTNIPSWAKRVTVLLSNLQSNSSSGMRVLIGDSSGPSTSGYAGVLTFTSANNTIGSGNPAIAQANLNTSDLVHGEVRIQNLAGNFYSIVCDFYSPGAAGAVYWHSSMTKTLSSELKFVNFLLNGGSTFNSSLSTAKIIYE